MRAAQAVDLALVRRAHHGKEHGVAQAYVGRQVGGGEEGTARGAATHEQAGNRGLNGILLWPLLRRPMHKFAPVYG